MPELPEVETIRRVLEPQVKGLSITAVTVNRPEVIGHPAEEEFCQVLMGQTICAMTRRGKFLSVLLDSSDYFVLHLRMTGCLLLTPADYPAEKHTHIVFHLSSGDELLFDKLTICPSQRKVYLNGAEIFLTTKELDLLIFLASHNGQVFTIRQIYEGITDDLFVETYKSLESCLYRLRKKIGENL